MDTRLEGIKELLNSYFKIQGYPAGDKLCIGQLQIVAAIFYKDYPRYACLAPTGYGKSEAIALGVILRVYINREDFTIASVKYDTADIIMKKVIEHIFDNDNLVAELEIDTDKKMSKLKRERKKQSVNFKGGGAIKIISLFGADADVSRAIGEHVPNVILDESPLLTPTKYLLLLKMLEGTGSYDDTFLFESGNAVNRNHFMHNVKTNSAYQHIDISLQQALEEKRLDQKSVDEKRGLPFFAEFYLCKFPEEDEIDENGYRQLVTTADIDAIMVDELEYTDDSMRLGKDVGGGGDYNVDAIRQPDRAWFEAQNRSNDTMVNVTETIRIVDKYEVPIDKGTHKEKVRLLKPEDIFIDDIGIGRGVTDRLIEKNMAVNGISVGMPANDTTKYANIKAENYWLAREWIKDQKHKLLRSDNWYQLTWIKYKINSDKVLKIEPKEELKKRTGKSPDHAEAFMLTFTEVVQPNVTWI